MPEVAVGGPTYEHFDGTEGNVVYRVWPAEEPRRIVAVAHGYGEHIGRYEYLAETLTADHAVVCGPDHLGHGRSDGERALVTDFEHLVDDLQTMVERVGTAYPGLPTVLIGHSLGGLVAARYAQRHADELAGLVLSAPVVGSWKASTDLLALTELPDEPLDSSTLSRDPAVAASYEADPMVYHGPFKQQTLRAIAGTLHVVNSGAGLGNLPTLWLHGQDDELVPLVESTAGIETLAPQDLTTRIYRGARHEVFNETNRDEVARDTVEFINRVTA